MDFTLLAIVLLLFVLVLIFCAFVIWVTAAKDSCRRPDEEKSIDDDDFQVPSGPRPGPGCR